MILIGKGWKDEADPTEMKAVLIVDEFKAIDSIAEQNRLLSGLMKKLCSPCLIRAGDQFVGKTHDCLVRVDIDTAFEPTMEMPVPRIAVVFEITMVGCIGTYSLTGPMGCTVEPYSAEDSGASNEGPDLWGPFLSTLGAPGEADDDTEDARGDECDGRSGDGSGRPVRPGRVG